jgi:hypothetical protein
LLVSVRAADEAAAAMQARVDLLDVKEPRRGALGRPAAKVFQVIVDQRDAVAPQAPVSLALGELAAWRRLPNDAAALAAAGPDFVKLGLQGLQRVDDWRDSWRRVREWFDVQCAVPPRAVMVAYADWRTAEAPRPAEVIAAAIDLECAGVLFDTCGKQAGGLLTQLSVNDLCALSQTVRAAGLFVAVAGQLQACDLPALAGLPIDIIAVRSAVCAETERTGALCGDRVRALRAAIQRQWRVV